MQRGIEYFNLPAAIGPLHLLLAMLLLAPQTCQARPGRQARVDRGPQVGEVAPDFTLATLDGESTVSLSDLRGEDVVLIFGSYT